MAIKVWHDALPTGKPQRDDGWTPDARPRFGHLLAEAWEASRQPKPRAIPGSRFRHSDAGSCARAIAYAALDVPPSDPLDLAGVWSTEQGTWMHEAWQKILTERFPGAKVEVTVGQGELSGHVDAVVSYVEPGVPSKVIAIECKSVGGYAFQLAIGVRGEAEGPRTSAVVQAALNAACVDADEAVIVYWSRDPVSTRMAERKGLSDVTGRFVAEWTMDRAMYGPIADAERERVAGILSLLDQGELAARKIPELPPRAVVVQPSTGAWVSYDEMGAATASGSTWHCDYCRWQTMCGSTAGGRVPVTVLKTLEQEEDR